MANAARDQQAERTPASARRPRKDNVGRHWETPVPTRGKSAALDVGNARRLQKGRPVKSGCQARGDNTTSGRTNCPALVQPSGLAESDAIDLGLKPQPFIHWVSEIVPPTRQTGRSSPARRWWILLYDAISTPLGGQYSATLRDILLQLQQSRSKYLALAY